MKYCFGRGFMRISLFKRCETSALWRDCVIIGRSISVVLFEFGADNNGGSGKRSDQ